jgi:hypothetical protein
MRRAITFACDIAVATLTFNFAPALAAEPQPGLWEIHQTVEPDGTARPTRTRCIDAEQASQFAELPSREATVGLATCKSVDLHKTDNGMTWTTQCPPLPLRIAASYLVDTPQHYTLRFRREMLVHGQVLASSTVTIEGRRIGECPK